MPQHQLFDLSFDMTKHQEHQKHEFLEVSAVLDKLPGVCKLIAQLSAHCGHSRFKLSVHGLPRQLPYLDS